MSWLTRPRLQHWRVAIETAGTVILIVLAKVVVEVFSADFIALSPLYTSVVAGGIFVIGLLVAGTLADYKEAERMPAEITAALENIHEDGVSIKRENPTFDLVRMRDVLVRIVSALRLDLASEGSRTCLAAINELSDSFIEMERLEVPPNYVVRLRAEQGTVRRGVLRIYHIQRTAFLPSAYVLIETIVALIIGALVFTRLDPLQESIVVLVFISYFFIYLVKLLRILDMPFRVRERTRDDVSLFLLNEFTERLERERTEVPSDRRSGETSAPAPSG